jgi:hypothetical protein
LSDSPPPSSPCYIVLGQRVGVGHAKLLIPNPKYKGKGHTKSVLSNPMPRVQRCRLPPKISGPPRMIEFSNDNADEEKEELSNELVASLKQKITALEEQVTELHLAAHHQQDDFGVLRKATMSKLK